MAVTTTYTRFKEMFMTAHTTIFNKKRNESCETKPAMLTVTNF